jgi:hypothetical protein
VARKKNFDCQMKWGLVKAGGHAAQPEGGNLLFILSETKRDGIK